VIRSRAWFSLLARVGGHDRRLQSGTYSFPRGAGSVVALRALASGRALQRRFTVPEGYTLLEMAEAAERQLEIPRAEFLAAARDPALLREFQVPAPARSFEGFLRPETYFFARGSSAATVVRAMASTFREDWDPAWDAAAEAQGLDRLAVVTLGSIIEGEARADSERPLIAAVYRNRLRLGMPLQADPTVIYGIEDFDGDLTRKDLETPTPYNTYTEAGLPPGPIANPGSSALLAALHPADVPYLYFVAREDGSHEFNTTLADHNRAVNRYQRVRRAHAGQG
jgi:UPF0755 protein